MREREWRKGTRREETPLSPTHQCDEVYTPQKKRENRNRREEGKGERGREEREERKREANPD